MPPIPYRLLGANASPYSMKMRAVLRYRRLPFIWEPSSPRLAEAFRVVKPAVVPVLQYPDGHFMNDSTPLAYDLEQRHPGARSIIPEGEGPAFLSDLIEDMADEWGTKCMFHYRWWHAADRDFASLWIVGDRLAAQATQGAPAAVRPGEAPAGSVGAMLSGLITGETLAAAEKQFNDRQVSRMALVGVTEGNKPVIEQSFHHILAAFNVGIVESTFMFGTRPSLADFAWFGQLWTLSMDPTASLEMRGRAPRVLPWLLRLEDASGVDGAWRTGAEGVSVWVRAMLALAGEIYLPFLKANATAIEKGYDTVSLSLPGGTYAQAPFKYQAKCYAALKSKLAGLPPHARAVVDPLLKETGCFRYLA
jgi:glutathione S-transferase